MHFIIFATFLVCGAFGNILIRIVSNSDFGKRVGARDMTMFAAHVGRHNIHW